MKLIDIGICVNNIDPKGIGRIRYRPYGMLVSEIEGGIKYEEWDDKDPFIAQPFLPLHINIVPQIQQSVKIIKYNTDKDTQNVEYVAGPYTSPHDMQNQTFAAQHRNTTFGGVVVKATKNIRNKNGKLNNPVTPGAIVNEKDTAFKGNYGSDVLFTENGVQIRGGSLISKQDKNKDSLLDYPQVSKKMGKLTLKKFPKTLQSVKEKIDLSKIAVSKIKYIVEYEINSLTTPTQLKLYVYRVIGEYGTQFNTDVFGENSSFLPNEVKLINTGNTSTDATYIKSLDGTINSAYIELRELLYLLDSENLTELNISYTSEDIHPFYFRPTSSFRLNKGTGAGVTNKATFLSKIQVRNKIGGSGLIFSRQSANPPIIPNTKTINSTKEISGAGEQSFSSLGADKVYILSTDSNTGKNVKVINFNELNEYELTQEDYISKIDPNTYALVRGENLYNLLIAIKNLLDSHIHNINEPLVKSDPNWIKLNNLVESLRDDLLNDSIRIN